MPWPWTRRASAKRDEEAKRRLKLKNWALFAALMGFAVIVYFVAIVRMGG